MAPKHRRSKLAAAAGIVLSAALALTACGSDDDTETEVSVQPAERPDVTIDFTITEDTEEVSIDGEFDVDQPTAWILSAGDGEEIAEGDLLQVLTADIDLDNEEIKVHDFDLGGQTLQLDERLAAGVPQTYETLVGATAGSDVALYYPPDSLGQGTPAYLNIISIQEILAPYATGADIPAADRNAILPEVTLEDDTQAPSIAVPTGDAPEELVVDVLKQGDGREVQEDSYVTIHYRGIGWSDGEEFDASWGPDNTGAPAQFELQQLIAGWRDGLAGQQVGSQVIMSVPPHLAYGEDKDHDLAEETLVFVIDILHSADPVPADQE